MNMKEDLIRIVFETHQQEVPAVELAARASLQAAIEQAIEKFQAVCPKTDVIEIEMYPCDCAECKAA
jgi:hypothetical protein